MSQTIISLIHCLQGKIDVTNVTHTWYLCFLCTTRGPHTQFLMAFSNYILQFYIWYELVHSFTSSQAKDKSCYREAKNTFLPKWNIVWILWKGSPNQTPGGYLWIQHFSHCSLSGLRNVVLSAQLGFLFGIFSLQKFKTPSSSHVSFSKTFVLTASAKPIISSSPTCTLPSSSSSSGSGLSSFTCSSVSIISPALF